MKLKLNIENVKIRCLNKGFELLDNYFDGMKFKHNFKCLIDNEIHQATFGHIHSGQGLKCCGIRKCKISSLRHRLSIKEVKTRSLEKGFKFLDKEYLGNKHKHNFYCLKDKKTHLSYFNTVNNGNGLKCCWIRKISGENNHLWNSKLTDKERVNGRQVSGLDKWKKQVKKRDNFRCQICGSKEKIHAHHLKNYTDNKELVIDIKNGITLCQKHHMLFHSKYGKKNNTKKQFKNFKTIN